MGLTYKRNSFFFFFSVASACVLLAVFASAAPLLAGDSEPSVKPVLLHLPAHLQAESETTGAFKADPQADKVITAFKSVLHNLHNQKQNGVFAQAGVTRPRNTSSFADVTASRPEIYVRRNGAPLQVRGRIPVVAGSFADRHAENIARAWAFLHRYRGVIGINNPDEELRLDSEHSINHADEAHLRFNQYYKNIPVWPAQLTVHLRSGDAFGMMNGAYVRTPKKPLPTSPVITASEAEKLAIQAVVQDGGDNISVVSEFVIYAPGGKQPPVSAWKCAVEQNAGRKWMVLIDATTGALLTHYSAIKHGMVNGAGTGLGMQTRSLSLWQQGANYYLIDTSKQMFQPGSVPAAGLPDPNTTNGAIFTLDLRHQEPDTNSRVQYITSTSPASGWLADGVSAAYNLGKVYDYYRTRHNRNSIDGAGGSMFSIVRVGQNYSNAFWNGQAMYFGDGMPFAGTLDVVAHELTHGVTQHTANLIYQDQPGALNEAMSDIFGEMVEAMANNGLPDWLLGSPPMQKPFRNIKDPHDPNTIGAPYPATMGEYVQTSEDNGGVHINSCIISHAFYLIAAGLPDAIGLTDAERIFYRALTAHLSKNSQFIDCRLAAVSSAEELFGQNSSQVAVVKKGFDAVGITQGPATPPPAGSPTATGDDSTLFTCLNPEDSQYYLCRKNSTDPPAGVFLSTMPINGNKPASVNEDGSIALFINADNDICLELTDGSSPEQCLGFSGMVNNVALSGDGQKFAFIFLDQTGEPENSISIYDQTTDSTYTIPLKAPTQDGGSIDSIKYADALTFTRDGSMLFFDALTVLPLNNNEKIQVWSIYGLNIRSKNTFFLVPPLQNLDTSYPKLSRANDNLLVFSASRPGSGKSTVYAGNLYTNTLGEVTTTDGEYAVADYTGNAEKIIYDTEDGSTPTGYTLLAQPVAGDHITPAGSHEVWIRDGVVPAVFQTGAHGQTAATTGYYDPATRYLHIQAVQAPGYGLYEADLLLASVNPLRFSLMNAVELSETPADTEAGTYQVNGGILTLPVITVTDKDLNSTRYRVVMQLDASNYFTATEVTQL